MVDEASVAISARILGGTHAITLAEGRGVARINDAVKLHVVGTKKHGNDLVLHYMILG